MIYVNMKKYLFLFFGCCISITLYGQGVNSPAQVPQKVGNYIISQTMYQAIDKSTSSVIANPDTTNINKNSVYKSSFTDWVYPNGVMPYGMMRADEIDTAYNGFLNYGIKKITSSGRSVCC
jgi:hypothetical protein